MLTFGRADAEMNACGDRPPYGSGLEGLLMVTVFCFSASASLRSEPP
jgi:hypothetical protein